MELKKMIEGITKKSPADQQLYNKEDAGGMVMVMVMVMVTKIVSVMEDDKSLSDYGLTSTVAKAQQPAEVRMVQMNDCDNYDGDGEGGGGALWI